MSMKVSIVALVVKSRNIAYSLVPDFAFSEARELSLWRRTHPSSRNTDRTYKVKGIITWS
jgi:hypothetical protein